MKAFLSFVFCLVVNNNSYGKLFWLAFSNLFLKLFLFFLMHFLVFSVAYLLILHNQNHNNHSDDDDGNKNENDNNNDNDNDQFSIFNLHQLLYLLTIHLLSP